MVGAMPSGASARPVHVGLAAVRNAERGEAHATPRGLRAPATPAPPFFGSPKKGGKESSPLATSQGLLPATRYALRTCQHTGVARVARTSPRPKALPPACARQGQKTPRRPARCGHVLLGGEIFALRRPRPYSRHCGEIVAVYGSVRHLCNCGHQQERHRGG